MADSPLFHAVVAMAANRVIGANGGLPWREPEDLKFFKTLTTGHAIVMGRKTFESIGRPLPRRRNIVLTRAWQPPRGVEVVHHPAALAEMALEGDVYVIGGAEVFRLFLPHCQSLFVSHLEAAYEGDTFMPAFESEFPLVETVLEFPTFKIRRHQRTSPPKPLGLKFEV